MPETLTTPTAPVEQPTNATTSPVMTEASASLKAAGDSWDNYTPTTEPVEGAEPVAEETEQPAVAEPATPEEQKPEAPDQFSAYTLDEAGRLHRPDGTYASAEEVTQYNATATEPAPSEATEPAKEPEPTAPQPERVTIRARNGEEVEVEVADPLIAEALRTNHKEGMRAKEFREKQAVLDAKLQELNAFDRLLQTNPEHVFLTVLPVDRQISIATKLIAQHWDQLAPTLVQFDAEPTARLRTAMQTQVDLRDGMTAYQRQTADAAMAGELAKAVVQLLPESIPDDLHDQFLADAEADITRAMQRGESVTPQSVPQILAPRLKLYGASPIPSAAAPTPVRVVAAVPAKPTAAQPVGATAVALANQKRIQQAAVARRRAAAVPPSGAGAAPVRVPPVPAGSNVTAASQALKKMGTSWTN